ncbi:DMT family transporter [Deinococcus fonticola]|uniref:DMT family transporter n=1 Tax=Deinococcus fonticola TaxID=2528713 RepID=UPI0010750577|nr:SMR family transporter [Deinococcus fonticola]
MKAAPLLLVLAAVLDVAANALLKRSDGFRQWVPGVLALLLVVVAFGLLGIALHSVPLTTAYATWGAVGLVLTALLSRTLDGTRLTAGAWLGLLLMAGSVVVLHR